MFDGEARDVRFLDALGPVAHAALREQARQAGIRAGTQQGTRDEQEAETGDRARRSC